MMKSLSDDINAGVEKKLLKQKDNNMQETNKT